MIHNRAVQHNLFNSRSGLLAALFLLAFGVISLRLFYLQIVKGAEAREKALSQHSIYQKLLPGRGEIKLADPFGTGTVPVATNAKSFLVYAVPKDILNPQLTSAGLGQALGLEAKDILAKITNTAKKYVPLKKALSEEEQNKIRELKLPGIFFDSEDTRIYPENNLLSQVIGFVGYKDESTKKIGLYGLERYFEKELAGLEGELSAEKDVSGAIILGADNTRQPAVDGMDLILTVDKTIQFQAESVIKETVMEHGADSGSVIIADPKTGAIIAMANYPDFNLNEFRKVENPGDFLNGAAVANYEPGSIFKPITMAAAIDLGKVGPNTTYVDTGVIEVDGYKIKNSDGKAHGLQTMTQVLDESLNTGAIFAKEQIGNSEFFKYLQKFGFGKATGIELLEGKGNIEPLKDNIKVTYHTASFGQGISVTPLQIIQSYTALANQGKMMKPYIVQSKIHPDGKIENTKPVVVEQVISAKAANEIGAMLVSVVDNGHGKRAGVPGYYIAGKTGTAQVPKKDGRGYEENNNIGSFVGFGPVEDPKFVMLVRINHPRTVKYAESTAAPAFGKLAQFILNYYHIPPTRQ